jgi:threonine/homoserine/homoserine lactone efflux protein
VIHFLTIGTILGLSAGLAPGPLLTLVISESLQHGVRGGVKVALAPVITDLPIILLTVFIAARFSGFQYGLGMASVVGGVFIMWIGYQSIRTKAVEITLQSEPPRSLLKGVVANLLNPHPYLFWLSVGAPTMSKALAVGRISLAAFLGGFYLSLVGSKILLALLFGRSRSFLSGRVYLYSIRLLGLLLLAFALVLFRDGARLLGLI